MLENNLATTTEARNALEAVTQPDLVLTLPDSIPRLGEITAHYQVLQNTERDLKVMLLKFTEQHPEVKVKKKEIEVWRKQFTNTIRLA